MITYLPNIYPDELLYSYFCRYNIHSGNITHKMSFNDLYTKRSDIPSQEFVGNLNTDIINILDKIYGIKNICINYTMFPYYARFFSKERKCKALNTIIKGNCDTKNVFSILKRCDIDNYFKYCPLCKKEDIKKYGETYWHRTHQIRNINICTKHKCKLHSSDISITGNHYIFYDAQNNTNNDNVIYVNNTDLYDFVKYLEEVFLYDIDFTYDIPIQIILCDAFKNTKYQKGLQRHISKFVDDFTIFYKELGINDIPTINQINRTLLVGDRFDFNTVCMIGYYLNISSYNLTYKQYSKAEIEKANNTHYAKCRPIKDYRLYDKEIYNDAVKYCEKIYYGDINIRPEKITKRGLCNHYGIKNIETIENMPLLKSLLNKYKESNDECRARKIVWSYNKLKDKEKIYWSDIRKLSGVKKEYLENAIPYMPKYINDNIKNLNF